ncbi:hypothetical protein B5M09_001487 [Aphanomyces astaci]|uniref:BZIP domain-containing protein n=1 Tax=Aphanomyces astaci TaxID=112090 RepID=A0A3R7Y705_APHAT|nr:hypothetical protein B5M09_001487 [Aphanomyces astaci]
MMPRERRQAVRDMREPAADASSRSLPAKRRATTKKPAKRVPDDKLDLRRTQSKMNQRRYRAEQLELMGRLQGEVASLTKDVARLEGRVGPLQASVPKNLRSFDPEISVANEYFRLFAQGYNKHSLDPKNVYQRDFLCSVMQPDLEFMGALGLEKLFTQWGLYTTLFQSVMMTCDKSCVVMCEPNIMLEGNARMQLRISRGTIEALFPHLLHNERLVQKLIGRVMVLSVLCQFTFDEHLKVQKFSTFANPVVALMDLLKSAEDTATAVSGCLLKENGELVPVTRQSLIPYGVTSKVNQRRYRAEQLQYETGLDEDVLRLTRDVARLEGRLETLAFTLPKNMRTFAPESKAASEYFRVFANGYATTAGDAAYINQHDFVRGVMRDDMIFMDSVGSDKVFEQGELYATLFHSVGMKCHYSHVISTYPDVMLEAHATLHLRISRTTMHVLFPHLLDNEPLIQKLLGRVLVMDVLCQFTFDEDFFVTRFNTVANPVVALMNLLHSIQDTTTALAGLRLKANAELPAKGDAISC